MPTFQAAPLTRSSPLKGAQQPGNKTRMYVAAAQVHACCKSPEPLATLYAMSQAGH